MLLNPPKDFSMAAIAISQALAQGPLTLLFVCTHNSRRSQLAEAWALDVFRDVPGLRVRSCGTERTQCHPNTASALASGGWTVTETAPGSYRVERNGISANLHSKTLDDLPSGERVVAFMTCAEADEACPAILGALARIPWRYSDPKIYDGTPAALDAYVETSNAVQRDLLQLRGHINPR